MPELATIPRSARVTTRGQLTIPQDIQGALDLDKRVSVNLFRVEKVLLITPVDFPSEPRSCIWAKTKAKFKNEGGQVKVVRAKGC